ARLLLRRAAAMGDAQAALMLGASFDPSVLVELGVLGFAPDVTQARAWYQQAQERGSAEPSGRLARLARLVHRKFHGEGRILIFCDGAAIRTRPESLVPVRKTVARLLLTEERHAMSPVPSAPGRDGWDKRGWREAISGCGLDAGVRLPDGIRQ